MIEAHGWFFPDGETHLINWMRAQKQMRAGRLQYQLNKYKEAMRWVRSRHLAVDVGAHVGHWSVNMADDFLQVVAFEPVPQYAECWRKNINGAARKAVLHEVALGAEEGTVSLTNGTPGSHGDTFVTVEGGEANAAQDVPLRTLDSFGLQKVSFLKVDAEGYEAFIIRGGEETIRRDRPCIIVEQKPGHAQKFGLGEHEAVDILEGWGAKRRAEISGDFVLSW